MTPLGSHGKKGVCFVLSNTFTQVEIQQARPGIEGRLSASQPLQHEQVLMCPSRANQQRDLMYGFAQVMACFKSWMLSLVFLYFSLLGNFHITVCVTALPLGTCCSVTVAGLEGVCTDIFGWLLPPGDILLFSGPCDLHSHCCFFVINLLNSNT